MNYDLYVPMYKVDHITIKNLLIIIKQGGKEEMGLPLQSLSSIQWMDTRQAFYKKTNPIKI